MGNRHGNAEKRKESKSKEEKKREKGAKKEQKKSKGKRKKSSGAVCSELDTDLDSSHVTGGDSESGVFHSAENLSASPYLDSCTRSELEQSGATWSGHYDSTSGHHHHQQQQQHPKVLSSRDFQDGFSLEAFLPPEIARRDVSSSQPSRGLGYRRDEDSVSPAQSTARSDGNSNSNSSFKSRQSAVSSSVTHVTPMSLRSQGEDAMSVSTSSQASGGGAGYSTPLLSTPVFARADRPASPGGTLMRVREADSDAMDITKSSRDKFYNSHLHNYLQQQHQQQQLHDFRNVPKPTSPHPQRRALSPKMTSARGKMISSDDSSSSPTTPTPQRRGPAHLLSDLFRYGGSKSEKKSKVKEEEKRLGGEAGVSGGKESGYTEGEGKGIGRGMWKTWERMSSKKSEKENRGSIFGTARKTEKKSKEKKDKKKNERENGVELKEDKNAGSGKETGVDKKETRLNESSKSSALTESAKSCKSSTSSASNLDTSSRTTSNELRNSSPPVVKSAAFCIMRLEELERSIENTIRDKFPDAEPFLLKRRTENDASRGSQSLPTTPSLKKKMYSGRESRNSRNGDSGDVSLNGTSSTFTEPATHTRYCHETFEKSPSPAMSPVVLRRFGARTRHASISPKIVRAKTAALYNSPSEMARVEESHVTKTITKVPVYHAVSTEQPKTPVLARKFGGSAHRSQLAHDTQSSVSSNSPGEVPKHKRNLSRQDCVDTAESEEEETLGSVDTGSETNQPVIIPTFSALFGSVSPKLRRHLQAKFVDIKKEKASPSQQRPSETHTAARTEEASDKNDVGKASKVLKQEAWSLRSLSLDSAVPGSTAGIARRERGSDEARPGLSQECEAGNNKKAPSYAPEASPVSVRARVKSINKSLSEGWQSSAPQNSALRVEFPDSRLESGETLPERSAAQSGHAKVEGTEKACLVASPSSARKHSTEHVVFGSAVALPCRLYAKPLPDSPEDGSVNNSVPAQAQKTIEERYAKEHAGRGGSEAGCAPGATRPTEELHASRQAAEKKAVNAEGTTGSGSNDNNADGAFKNSTGQTVNEAVGTAHATPSKQGQGLVGGGAVLSRPSRDLPLQLQQEQFHDPHHKKKQQQQSLFSKEKPQHGSIQYSQLFQEEEQRFVVLKHPVSQVISDMINVSKQHQKLQQHQHSHDHEQQQQQQHHPHQHQTLRQSSPTSLDQDLMRFEPATATLTSPTYEQPCLVLEEKTVFSDGSSVSLPSSPIHAKKKDSDFAAAGDQPVNDDDLDIGEDDKLHRDERSEIQRGGSGSWSRDNSDSEESSQFLRDVRDSSAMQGSYSSSQGRAPPQEEGDLKHQPPPPSPTAMTLLEEFEEEEDEDEDVEESKRKAEMQDFTEKIFNRLSDLVGSRSLDDENDIDDINDDDDVFDAPPKKSEIQNMDDLISCLEERASESADEEEIFPEFLPSASVMSASMHSASHPVPPLGDDLLSSTTSSSSSASSDLFMPPRGAFPAQMSTSLEPRDYEGMKGVPKRKLEPEVFLFPDRVRGQSRDDSDRLELRDYHSDDDVARGHGIPDYYDDRPLWTRRQKPPGQLSLDMMAIRRRERRERWLKKRRRNKTDLLSTGSSDTGSESPRRRGHPRLRDATASLDDEEEEEDLATLASGQRKCMGSGILSSPKYSKPILPFFDKGAEPVDEDVCVKSMHTELRSELVRNLDTEFEAKDSYRKPRGEFSGGSKERADEDDDDDRKDDVGSSTNNLAIPGIEETFNELMSVKYILEGLQERTHAGEQPGPSAAKFMPLTAENVKSVREYYRDFYSSGNGRRSRMSLTDRTESDLDISEHPDDASTDSNMYADDEDEDGAELYTTADDEAGSECEKFDDEDDEEDEGYVVSCTFYNSKAFNTSHAKRMHASSHSEQGEDGAVGPSGSGMASRRDHRDNSTAHRSQDSCNTYASSSAGAGVAGMGEEFLEESAAIEETYRQLETAADAVSSTFQNAREQMIDIQQHLQALRRQMEGLQDDVVSTSITLTPDMSLESK